MNITFKHSLIALAAGLFLFTTSCSKDDDTAPEEENENEVITKVELHFNEVGTENDLVFSWSDPDGEGGNNPVIEEIALAPNKTYNVSIKLLDEVNNEDVTEEIEEEAVDHRFYYSPSDGANITVTDLDKDNNGVSVGIASKWATGAAADGNVHITLRHYPEGGKAESDLVTSSKSSTDADLVFQTSIQ